MLNEAGMKIARALADLDEVKEAAKEPAIKTTQDSYGHYAGVIGAIADATGRTAKEGHFLAAEALKIAGGNARGIDAAMHVFYGYGEYDPLSRMLRA